MNGFLGWSHILRNANLEAITFCIKMHFRDNAKRKYDLQSVWHGRVFFFYVIHQKYIILEAGL